MAPKEIMHRTSSLPHQKMKPRVNHVSLTSEEAVTLKNDGVESNKNTQQANINTKKFFATLLDSNDPKISKHTDAEKKTKLVMAHIFFMEMIEGRMTLSL